MSYYKYCKDRDSYFETKETSHEHFHKPEPCCTTSSTCAPLKTNCKPECCSGLPKVTPNLNSIYSVPILTTRIFDCIKLENSDFSISDPIKFDIISSPPPNISYQKDLPVCVDKVCLQYDIIGATVTGDKLNGNITVCSKTVNPKPISPITISGTTIANDFLFTVNNNPCCYNNQNIKPGTNCRVLERNLNFNISNLKITVVGKAGCIPFIAEYKKDFATLADALGFNGEFNFFGKICLPNSNSGVLLKETFDEYLSVECVEPISKLKASSVATPTYSFDATVESSLLIIKNLYALVEDMISVLAIKPTEGKFLNNCSLINKNK